VCACVCENPDVKVCIGMIYTYILIHVHTYIHTCSGDNFTVTLNGITVNWDVPTCASPTGACASWNVNDLTKVRLRAHASFMGFVADSEPFLVDVSGTICVCMCVYVCTHICIHVCACVNIKKFACVHMQASWGLLLI
jgi:hypothetical protein